MRRAKILVAGLAVAAFLPALWSGFVYDDGRFVVENTAIRSLANTGDFLMDPRVIDPEGWQGIYRPLRTFSFAVDRAVFGPGSFGFHLTSLVLHALASVLVLMFLRRLGVAERAADDPLTGFLAKPYRDEDLIAHLDSLLRATR